MIRGDAMNEKNVNYGINHGHIGDRLYIYKNIQAATSLFIKMHDEETDGLGISEGHQNLLTLELFIKYADDIGKEFDKALNINRYPLKIRVTQLVNDCAQGVYYNGGNMDKDVWKIVDGIVTLICALRCGDGFYAERVKVGEHLYYELHPEKE